MMTVLHRILKLQRGQQRAEAEGVKVFKCLLETGMFSQVLECLYIPHTTIYLSPR